MSIVISIVIITLIIFVLIASSVPKISYCLKSYFKIIKRNKKKFILNNIILFIFCWIYVLIPVRSILSIPLSGIKMNNINEVDVDLPISKTEKDVFLAPVKNLKYKNKYVKFDSKIHIKITSSEKKISNERFSNGHATMNGYYKKKDDLKKILTLIGISSDNIQESYNLTKLYEDDYERPNDWIDLYVNQEERRVSIYISTSLPPDYNFEQSTSMGRYGTTSEDLKKSTTTGYYFLTLERIYAKKRLLIDILIKLFILFIILGANIYIISKKRKASNC